ncbi:cell adhesion molecule DSCAM-like isoform X2 [Sycon ciliatum]|uniref:cell adhesion molecule DSCAM-like isoform X2 n=1 Tax=Sycon ciliatum TaxID=27933 RepID=UPI0031F65D02
MTGRHIIVPTLLIFLTLFKHGLSQKFPREQCHNSVTLYNVSKGEVLYGVEGALSTSLPSITCCIRRSYYRRQPYPASKQYLFFQNSPVANHPHLGVSKHVDWYRHFEEVYYYPTIVWPHILTKDIAGEYKCSRFDLDPGWYYVSFYLVVGEKPKITFITNSVTVMSTSWKIASLALHCNASGDELKYSWTKDGVPLRSALGADGWTHSFAGAVTAADSGIYNCSASSRYGHDWKQLHLLVLDIPRFWLKPVPAIIMPHYLLARSVGLLLTPPSSTGNSPITSYEVICRPDVEYRSYVKDTVQRFSVTSVTVTGLQPATKYSCWYHVWNAVGRSGPSPILKLTTPESPPGKPENLSTVSSSAGHVTTFFKPISPVLSHGVLTGYQITFNATECVTHQDCPCQQYNCSLRGAVSFHESWVTNSISLSGLRYFTTYQISVAAVNRAGVGQKAWINFTPKEFAPGPVNRVVAMVISSSAVQTKWEAPRISNGDILYYTLEYSMVNSQSSVQRVKVNISTAMLQYNITGLLNNSDVLITVFAVNSAGPGPGVTTRVSTADHAKDSVEKSPSSSPPSQTKVFCAAPTDFYWIAFVASSFNPETIFILSQNVSHKQTVNVTCKDGLYVSGNLSQQHQVIKCQDNGTWSEEFVACSDAQPAQMRGYYGSKSSSNIVIISTLGGTTAIFLVIIMVFLVIPCIKRYAGNTCTSV